MFNGFDTSKDVKNSAEHDRLGPLASTLALEQSGIVNLSSEDTVRLSMPELQISAGLKFSFRGGAQSPVKGRIRATGDGFHVENPASPCPLKAEF